MTFDESFSQWFNSDEYKKQKNNCIPYTQAELDRAISSNAFGPDYEYYDEIAKEAQKAQDEYNWGVKSLQDAETLRGLIK